MIITSIQDWSEQQLLCEVNYVLRKAIPALITVRSLEAVPALSADQHIMLTRVGYHVEQLCEIARWVAVWHAEPVPDLLWPQRYAETTIRTWSGRLLLHQVVTHLDCHAPFALSLVRAMQLIAPLPTSEPLPERSLQAILSLLWILRSWLAAQEK